MITEIYIDNFKCLSNFKITPKHFQLWLGDNGSGKSAVLDALHRVRLFLSGQDAAEVFHSSSLTVWDKRLKQTFSFCLECDGDKYRYELLLESQPHGKTMRILREEMQWQGRTFFLHDGQDAHLYRTNRYTNEVEKGTSFPVTGGRSVIASIAERDDNTPLITFRKAVAGWLFIQPIPTVMDQYAESEAPTLSRQCANFAAWYRHLLQEFPGIGYKARDLIAEVLPGFEHLSMKDSGEARRLKAAFSINEMSHDFDFSELSDGQRQLIVLYTVLEALRAGLFTTLIIDEPDNYVSLREIQPWIEALSEICDDHGRQAIIISHHPEVVNRMARGDELWFHRTEGGHVQTAAYPSVPGLTPAETMARGWDHE